MILKNKVLKGGFSSDAIEHGCPTLLAIDCPAKLSSNFNQTDLKQLIKDRLKIKDRCVWLELESLQDSRSPGAGLGTPAIEEPFKFQKEPFSEQFNLVWRQRFHF